MFYDARRAAPSRTRPTRSRSTAEPLVTDLYLITDLFLSTDLYFIMDPHLITDPFTMDLFPVMDPFLVTDLLLLIDLLAGDLSLRVAHRPARGGPVLDGLFVTELPMTACSSQVAHDGLSVTACPSRG